MSAVFKSAWPYAKDALHLPVKSVDDALPFYETVMGFTSVSHQENPKTVILGRDQIKIGLCENGGDPSQEGCFFEVDNIEAAFEEIKGKPGTGSDFRIDKFGDASLRVFFVVAPDGLCYMLGERIKKDDDLSNPVGF